MNPADIELGLAIFRAAQAALATLKALKDNSPEVYDHIAQHHGDVLADAKAAQAGL